MGDSMTFSEYFNGLYPYLSDGDKQVEFFDAMIGHFIHAEAQESCELLNCQLDTKRRYIKTGKPNKIKPEYAKYAYSQHSSDRYVNWLGKIMYEMDAYDKVDSWLETKGIEFNDECAACDTLLTDIFFYIAYPGAADGSEVELPKKAPGDGSKSLRLTENDMSLLKEFHIDFDSILEKCIRSDQSEVWFTRGLSRKIDRLYNEKWRDGIARFNNISLQSNILGTIAALQDFCNAMDPDSDLTPVTSVRRLRIKLRDCYVKIHPADYAGIFPYEAFIDDWNDFDL